LLGVDAALAFNRRYILPTLVLAALLGVFLAGAYLAGSDASDGKTVGGQKTSQHGLFLVRLEPEGGRVKSGEMRSWLLTLETASGAPVEYAAIDVSGGMPRHAYGLPSSPQATDYLGQGRYRLEGLKFTTGGWWQLRIAISAAAGSDTVVFDIVL